MQLIIYYAIDIEIQATLDFLEPGIHIPNNYLGLLKKESNKK